MLSVHLDQGRADLSHGGHTGRLIVDIGPAATVGAQDAAKDQIFPRLHIEPLVGDQGQQIGIVGSGEDGGGNRLFGAIAH